MNSVTSSVPAPEIPVTVLKPSEQVHIASDITFDTYTFQPIDGFGEKILNRLGWK